MFDIDRYLDGIALAEAAPSQELVRSTAGKCGRIAHKRAARRPFAGIGRKALVALPAAALLAAGVFIGAVFLPPRNAGTPGAAAYYTVDINPSLCVAVDGDGLVTAVSARNEDGENLLPALDCVGYPVTDVIERVIRAAGEAGYLPDGQAYVLIGYFGGSDAGAQAVVDRLRRELEADFGDMINLLLITGTLEDVEDADKLDVSPGLLKLSRMAGEADPTGAGEVEDIVDEIAQSNRSELRAPVLSARAQGADILLSWSELDLGAMGYTGRVRYYIVAGDSRGEVEELGARTMEVFSFYSNEQQIRSCVIRSSNYGIGPGEEKYYGIYVQYSANTFIRSNVVCFAMPAQAAPSPSPSPAPSPSASPSPKPVDRPATAQAGNTVTGRISGQYVTLSWEKDDSAQLAGYKIVASQTNPNPKYPDDGYLKFITDAGTTSVSLYAGYGGLKAGQSYYFSVTYLYVDGSAVAGNAVRLQVPARSTAEPAAAAGYAASTVSGSVEGTAVCLSWTRIDDSRLDGYKVMYSFTDATPVYGEAGCQYAYWITDAATTSCTVEAAALSGYAPGRTCYFSITALYEGHGVKKAGNAISLVMPDGEDPAEEYVSTGISGSIEGSTVSLTWTRIDDSRLDGYKVMYSFTDATPVYGEAGCRYAYWITDAATTGCTVDITSLEGYASGKTCYFSISALYDGHSVVMPGNAIGFSAP